MGQGVTLLGLSERRALSRDWSLSGDVLYQEFLGGPYSSSLIDDFNDGSVDLVKWANSYGSLTETGGRLQIPCTTSYAGLAAPTVYAFDSVSVQLFPPALAGATTECYLALFVQSAKQNTAVPGTDIGVTINRIDGTINFINWIGFSDPGIVTLTYDPVAHAYVRMRLVGGDVLWETSPDYVTWTLRRTLNGIPVWLRNSDMQVFVECHRSNGTSNFGEVDNFNVGPSTSTTPVSSTLDLRWQVRNAVASVSDLRWAVAATVAGALDLRWSVRNSVSSAVDLRWAVRSQVSSTVDLRWAVDASSATVTSTVDLRWAVAATVSSTVDLRWAVRASVSSTADLRWAVASTVSGAVDLRWAVRTSVSSAVDLRWAVRSLVSTALDLRWAVRSSVSGSVDLRWAIASAVQSLLDVRWALRNLVEASVDLRWAQRALVESEVELLWAIQAPELSPIPLPPTLAADLTLRVRSSPEEISVRYVGPRTITARLEE